jgi:phage virion morphogenesis protein
MAGVTLTFEYRDVLASLDAGIAALQQPSALQRDIGELLLIIHQARFKAQIAPDGTPWQALSPGYARSKRKNQDKVLTLDGFLRGTLRYQLDGDDLLFGTDRPYGAIHQFGGDIKRQARQSTVYFRQDAAGQIGRQFVRKSKSNFAQDVKMGPYTITMPARPWLGVSPQDDARILARVQAFLRDSLAGSA